MRPNEEALENRPLQRGPSLPQRPSCYTDQVTGYGGDSTLSDDRLPGIFRIIGGNVGGLSPSPSCQVGRPCPGGCKDCFLISKVLDLNAQVACWNEINLNWASLDETSRAHSRYPHWFPACQLRTSHLPGPSTIRRRFGGTMSWSINQAVHRLDNSKSGTDSMGRWTWTYYRGRDGRSLVIVSAYRPVFNPASPGSVYNQ